MNNLKIAVIIPFFQRESGILDRALRSICNQNYPNDFIYVIVVDDGSPISAIDELASYPLPNGLRVNVIRKENSGPNEARNTGLENLDKDTDLVAYLDSDDEWIGEHLNRAIKVISNGYSAYFANLYHLGDIEPEFEKAKRVQPAEHPAIANDPSLREYIGDMVHQISTANIIFMPSLIIDVRVLGNARFPQAHRHGGGDYLYWMDLIQHGARFAFSTLPEVRCGRGINMWYGSGWGTDGLAKRILDESRFRKTVLTKYAKTNETKKALQGRLAELHVLLMQDIVHRVRHGKSINWRVFSDFHKEIKPNVIKSTCVALKRLVHR